jgi:CRP-like cAMP-binding protein
MILSPKFEKSVNPNLDSLKLICSKNPKFRSPDDIEFLFNLTKNNKVFSSLSSSKGPSLHRTCCKYLNYEFCEGGTYLFTYGSKGSKFYIILSGTIGVEVPKNSETFEEILQLNDGDCFGELALESDRPRQASIKCKVDCHFIYLHKKDYQDCLGNFIKDRRNQMVTFLSGLPLFQDFTKGTLAKISYILKEKTLKKGHILFKENEPSSQIFFIKTGEAGFFKKLRAKNDKKISSGLKIYEVNVANKAQGEMFGEEEVMISMNRVCTCKVTSDFCEFFTADKNVKSIQEFFKSVRNEEFWKLLKSRALNQLQQIENRVNLLCDLKKAEPLIPMGEREKLEDVKTQRLHRKSMTNINNFLERRSVDFSEKNLEKNSDELPGLKRSSTIIQKFALLKENSLKSQRIIVTLPQSPMVLTPNGEKGESLKRSKSSLSSVPENSFKPISSILEVLEDEKPRNILKGSETNRVYSRCSSGLGYLTTVPSVTNMENVKGVNVYSAGRVIKKRNKETRMSLASSVSEQSNQKKFKFFNERILKSSEKSGKASGVSIYPMNSFPVYLALWSANPRIF